MGLWQAVGSGTPLGQVRGSAGSPVHGGNPRPTCFIQNAHVGTRGHMLLMCRDQFLLIALCWDGPWFSSRLLCPGALGFSAVRGEASMVAHHHSGHVQAAQECPNLHCRPIVIWNTRTHLHRHSPGSYLILHILPPKSTRVLHTLLIFFFSLRYCENL